MNIFMSPLTKSSALAYACTAITLREHMYPPPTSSPLSQGYAAELQSVGATTGQLAADSSNVVTLIRTAFNVRHSACGWDLWGRGRSIYGGRGWGI